MVIYTYTGIEHKKFKVTVKCAAELSDKDKNKLFKAVRHFAKAISSEKFSHYLGLYKYQIKKCKGLWGFRTCETQNIYDVRWGGDRTRWEIYEHILSGKEVLQPEEDSEADIELEIDYRNSRGVIGYTYPSTIKQWIYYTFFNKFDYKEIAGNLAHEYCHKLGYKHERKYNKLRKHTVPYLVGYFVRDFKEE